MMSDGGMTKERPLVSIIVPNYNYARFLPERMDSIFGQTFSDYEIILLDDASSDGSVELLHEYAGHPAVSRLCVNDINSGNPFAQWKKGVSLARGQYVWIAESDDSADSCFLEKSVKLLERHKSAALCFSSSVLIDDKSESYGKSDWDKWRRRKVVPGSYYLYNGDEFNRHCQFWNNNIYNASGTVFRNFAGLNEIFERVLPFRYAGDWFFWSLLSCGQDVIILNERLNRFRIHAVSVTNIGARSGAQIEERIAYIDMMSGLYDVDGYRKFMRIGDLLRKIRNSRLDKGRRKYLEDKVSSVFNVRPSTMYWLYYINHIMAEIFPFIHIGRNDYRHPAARMPELTE